MAASNKESSPHLVDELEKAFQNSFTALINQEHFNTGDSDETRTVVDHAIQKFMEVAKETENFFLQKRLQLSTHRPELVIKEDINLLKAELIKKDELLQKHYNKLQQWQNLLQRCQQAQPMQPGPGASQAPQQPVQGAVQPTPPVTQPIPPQQQAHFGQGPLHYLEQTTSSIGLPERR